VAVIVANILRNFLETSPSCPYNKQVEKASERKEVVRR